MANGLGIELPEPAQAAQPTRDDLPPSGALSIVARGPERFEGRKLGMFMSDGADAALFAALVAAIDKAGGVYEVIAPKIAGVRLSDGKRVPAKQKIDGGPSVLYDAVALLMSAEGASMLAKDAPSKDFVRDAFAHCKFIAYSEATGPLLDAAGIASDLDKGCLMLRNRKDASEFCRGLRQA